MLVLNSNIQKQNNYTRTVGYYPKTVNITVSVPKYDGIWLNDKEYGELADYLFRKNI